MTIEELNRELKDNSEDEFYLEAKKLNKNEYVIKRNKSSAPKWADVDKNGIHFSSVCTVSEIECYYINKFFAEKKFQWAY